MKLNLNLYLSRNHPLRRAIRAFRVAKSRLLPQREQFTPDIHTLSVATWYGCNLTCAQCFHLAPQAPTKERMAPDYFAAFLCDSARLAWPWKFIHLSGGESTLNPDFPVFVRMLADYKARHLPSLRLGIATNGVGDKVERGINLAVNAGFEVNNSNKIDVEGAPADHRPFFASPADMGENYTLGCLQSSKCGIVLNCHGFYECDPAAGADRVMGWGPVATRLDDVTEKRMAAAFHIHCKHCGLARRKLQYNPNAPMTETWMKQIAAYNTKTKGNHNHFPP